MKFFLNKSNLINILLNQRLALNVDTPQINVALDLACLFPVHLQLLLEHLLDKSTAKKSITLTLNIICIVKTALYCVLFKVMLKCLGFTKFYMLLLKNSS